MYVTRYFKSKYFDVIVRDGCDVNASVENNFCQGLF